MYVHNDLSKKFFVSINYRSLINKTDTKMRLAIVGTREPKISYEEWKQIILSKWWLKHADTIVSGGARGIDTYGKKLATELNLKCKEFKPDYKKDGRGAPLKRNTLIFENSDFVAAFPQAGYQNGEVSRGTVDSIRKAKKLNKRLYIIEI